MRRRPKPSTTTAERLLKDFLTPGQYADWRTNKAFNLRTRSGRIVRIHPLRRHTSVVGKTSSYNIAASSLYFRDAATNALGLAMTVRAIRESLGEFSCYDPTTKADKVVLEEVGDYGGEI